MMMSSPSPSSFSSTQQQQQQQQQSEKVAIVTAGHTTCYHCNQKIAVKYKNSGGASYAHTWKRVPLQCTRILNFWLSNSAIRFENLEKKTLRATLEMQGLVMNDGAFDARISELVGMRLIRSSKQVKSSTHNTTSAPTYALDEEKVIKMINNGGKI